MLQSQRRERIEPARLAFRVVEHQPFHVAQRHAPRCRSVRGFYAEAPHRAAQRQLTQRERASLDDDARRIVQPFDRAADFAAIAEKLERPEVGLSPLGGASGRPSAPSQPGVFTLGPLINSSRRCVSDVPDRAC